jgi:excisionase family DNA binding protein
MSDTPEEQDTLLSIREAAKFLKVSYKTMYRMVRDGRVPRQRVGWQWRIKKSSLDGDIEASHSRHEKKK